MSYESLFLQALGITILLEALVLPLAVRLMDRGGRPSAPVWSLCLAAAIASAATLPYLWFVLPRVFSDSVQTLISGEIMVAAAEAGIIKLVARVSWDRALVGSVACNAVSLAAGGWFG